MVIHISWGFVYNVELQLLRLSGALSSMLERFLILHFGLVWYFWALSLILSFLLPKSYHYAIYGPPSSPLHQATVPAAPGPTAAAEAVVLEARSVMPTPPPLQQ